MAFIFFWGSSRVCRRCFPLFSDCCLFALFSPDSLHSGGMAAIACTLGRLADVSRSPAVMGPASADAWVVAAPDRTLSSRPSTSSSSDTLHAAASALVHAAVGALQAGAIVAGTHYVVSVLTAAPKRHSSTRRRATRALATGGAAAAATAAWRLVGCAYTALAGVSTAAVVRAASGAAAGIASGRALSPLAARVAAAAALLRLAQGAVGAAAAGDAAPRAADLTAWRWCPPLPPSLPHPALDGAVVVASLAALGAGNPPPTPTASWRLVGVLLLLARTRRGRPSPRTPRPMYGSRAVTLAAARLFTERGPATPSPRHPWAAAAAAAAAAYLPLYILASVALPEAITRLGGGGGGTVAAQAGDAAPARRAAAAGRAARSAVAGLAAAAAFAAVGEGLTAVALSSAGGRRQPHAAAIGALAGGAAGVALVACERRPFLAEAGLAAGAAALARASPGGPAWVDVSILGVTGAVLAAWAGGGRGGPASLSPAPTPRLAPLPAAVLAWVGGGGGGRAGAHPGGGGGGRAGAHPTASMPVPPAAAPRPARGTSPDWSLEPGDVLGGESSSSFEEVGRPSPSPPPPPARLRPAP